MPELPEVEHFRRILLPLVHHRAERERRDDGAGGDDGPPAVVALECPPPLPTKRFPSREVVDVINGGEYFAEDVLRKGKVLCIVLRRRGGDSGATSAAKGAARGARPAREETEGDDSAPSITGREPTLYLTLHMGMTGRISSSAIVPGLESLSGDDSYPPPHTHLIIRSGGEEAAFSDPRRFGSVLVEAGAEEEWAAHGDCIPTFKDIAPDALELCGAYCSVAKHGLNSSGGDGTRAGQPSIVDRFANRKKGIKGLLLDQRAVVSGVGNWVADEVLYQSHVHPDQSYLDEAESGKVVEELHHVLSTAVVCLNDGVGFPEEWIFHRRWRNGGGGSGTAKDFYGRTITFIQSGGRSTAMVPSLQKMRAGKKASTGVKKVAGVGSKRSNSKGKAKGTDGENPADALSKRSTGKDEKKGVEKPKLQRKRKKVGAGKELNASTSKSSEAQGRKRKRVDQVPQKPTVQPSRRSKRLASR